MILAAVLFTINPVEEAGRPLGLNMGTVPLVCVLWLCVVGVITQTDLVRGLYGTVSLRPYHLIVMFTGSVYLCTTLTLTLLLSLVLSLTLSLTLTPTLP